MQSFLRESTNMVRGAFAVKLRKVELCKLSAFIALGDDDGSVSIV
jgi:hypothetical protein